MESSITYKVLESVGREMHMLEKDEEPDLGVSEGLAKTTPGAAVELLADCVTSNTVVGELSLLGAEPSRSQGLIRKSVAGRKGEDKGDNSLKNKQPFPTTQTRNAIHLENARGDEPRKSRRENVARVENANARCEFLAGVESRQHVERTGVVGGLDDTKKEAHEDEAGVVLDDGGETTGDGPEHHEAAHVPRGLDAGDDHVAGDLTESISHE